MISLRNDQFNKNIHEQRYSIRWSCRAVELWNFTWGRDSSPVTGHCAAMCCAILKQGSINQSINQSDYQSIYQSINQSINQSDYQSINQSIRLSIYQSNNQTINLSINQPISRPSSRAGSKYRKKRQISEKSV